MTADMSDPFTGTFFQRYNPHFRLDNPLYCNNFPANGIQFPAIDFPANANHREFINTTVNDSLPEYSAIDTLATMQLYADIMEARRIHEEYLVSLLLDAIRRVVYDAFNSPTGFALVNVVLPGFGNESDKHVVVIKRGENPVQLLIVDAEETQEELHNDLPIAFHNTGYDRDLALFGYAMRRHP